MKIRATATSLQKHKHTSVYGEDKGRDTTVEG